MLQANWATVVRRRPALQQGTWVAYSNAETLTKKVADQIYQGRARIISPPLTEGREAPAEWYEWTNGTAVHAPLPNGEAWHLHIDKCYLLKGPLWANTPNRIIETDPDQLYLVYADKKGSLTKKTIKEILDEEEEPSPVEKFGPAFIKKATNSKLAAAQLLRADTKRIKENKWVKKYNIDLQGVHKGYRKTFAHSKIKGFIWLLVSHALPVGTRLFGKESNTTCPRCGHHKEDIEHMAVKCPYAKDVRKATFKEWFVRTGDSKGYHHLGTKEALFNIEVDSPLGTAWATLNAILLHHLWKDRCNKLYRQEKSPPAISLTNAIWTEFEASLQARTKEIALKIKWWSNRAYVNLVPSKVASQHQEELYAYGSKLSALLPDWLTSVDFSEYANYVRNTWTTKAESEDFMLLEQTPIKYPRLDFKWRLSSHPKPGKDALVIQSDSEAESDESQNSTSGSGD
jgi:hypothetical protein